MKDSLRFRSRAKLKFNYANLYSTEKLVINMHNVYWAE